MPDERPVLDQLLDLTLYVPVGLALEARRLLPELADKGRLHLDQRLRLARIIGQFAVQQGRRELSSRAGKVAGQVLGRPDSTRTSTRPAPVPSEAPPSTPPTPERDVPIVDESVPLPIEGYDALAASQVVARLDDLDHEDLEHVRAYEQTHRRRRTILAKIDQLEARG